MSRPKAKRVSICGNSAELVYTRRGIPRKHRANCDPPQAVPRKVRIDPNVAGEEKTELLIHELLHLASWPIDEAFISQFADEAAAILHREGLRWES
jgi:hypothetical protein